ncbi:MAG: tyrosine-type recombinase/integrase [Oscillospiraceae bacterium]|nr:tyrosine-type recombinase/integrase [Oscillospiraceae bacterium]
MLFPHLSPHILRHSFASRAVESNAIPPKHLQTMLGHSSIQVTMDIYAEISDEALQNSMSAFDGILAQSLAHFTVEPQEMAANHVKTNAI